ncbi:MAG: acetyl-CoA carboxylase, carboxyltransferase subunit beta [Spirochaetota bacterium]|jgi:acetyl-CoA carboxylase carboxyl transferase subunit beta|nr:acetyl-CoA carboxylase, carboxyltransferase subunit beta [Spirochaetota bacterium]
MAWFTKPKYTVLSSTKPQPEAQKSLWTKCEGCSETIYNKEWEENLCVCPKCGYHQRISARDRILLLLDPGSFVEEDAGLSSMDPLGFADAKGTYIEKLRSTVKKTGFRESVVAGSGRIDGRAVEIAVMDFDFLGGSLGSVAGEKICRAIDRALKHGRPLIISSCSGGARMHEGIISLMQMAKTSAWLAKLNSARLPFISLVTHPTTGGVTASFASLGDLIIAEPGALIGFAGPRVIEQTIRQKLPEGFQSAEFLRDHGFVDCIVPRSELKAKISRMLAYLHTQ